MTVSSAYIAVAANIAPTAKQIILPALILFPFQLGAARGNIYSARTPIGKAPSGFASGVAFFSLGRLPRGDGIPRRRGNRVLSRTPCRPCDVDQRNDHSTSADNLSEIREIVEIHGIRKLLDRICPIFTRPSAEI